MVYCLSGGRSTYAANLLAGRGFPEVYNLEGGIMKWNAKNKPIEREEFAAKSTGMSKNQFDELINSGKLVLVDYNAKWCKPCQKMAPMLEALASTQKHKLTLVKIDVDENKALSVANGIEAIPVLELYENGKRVWRHEGDISESKLREQTER
jgi:thioredoxin 1